jgi:hypothetical protein
MTGVRGGSQGTGLIAGSQGTGVSGSVSPSLLIVSDMAITSTFNTPADYTFPVEAVDGTFVIAFFSTSGLNPIVNGSSGWDTIYNLQRHAAFAKIVDGDTSISVTCSSGGVAHYGFMVYSSEPVISQVFAGNFGAAAAQPINIHDGIGNYTFATKTAVPVGSTVWGWRHASNDIAGVPVSPATKEKEFLTTAGADSASTLFKQVGAGADITIGFTGLVSTTVGGSFVVNV